MSCYSQIDLNQTVLAGATQGTLQGWLAQAQQAYADVMMGNKPVEVTYTQGDGQRAVTYTRTNIQQLTMWIKQLQIQLGTSRGRRPIRPLFSGR